MKIKSSYKDRFEDAYTRTRRFGLNPPHIKYSADTFLTKEFMADIPHLLFQEYGAINPDKIFANCMGFHYMLKPLFEYQLSSDVYFTLGYVTVEEDKFFYINDAMIAELLKEGIKSTLSIHAWLTLPTMEILDFTLPTTYAQAKNIQEGMGGVISKKADDLSGNMIYHPMLIGDHFLRKIGALVEF